ncbi:MAG TPA: fluoride efflux transporter CrcB [Tepidisphaeraceae bacterium]|nr:fluoride efflux transporter CrcB [Tepidisphaeraceae bacterium]
MKAVLIQALAIGAGGFVGALTRWGVAVLFGRLFPVRFPIGTFFINITGSFFLGWFLTFVIFRYPVSDTTRLAIATGFVGAYTTFSTYMFESVQLSDQGATLEALVNLLGSVIVGVIAVKLGMIMAHPR